LRVIFKLPEVLKHFEPVPKTWPTHHLAYVKWYKLSNRPGTNHNMYVVFKSAPLANGVVPGEIVPLTAIRQSCQLIPLTGPNISWPPTWKSHNVLDLSHCFLLNNWSSKFAYQTIW
ncbi:hypothetical protein EDB19DRAFT_1627811, partial [Suillus lakei]